VLGKTKAIVLHSIKQGESGRIVKLYTETYGMCSVFLRATQSKKRGSTAALYQPLTVLDMDLEFRQDRSLQKVVSAELITDEIGHLNDPMRACVAMFMAELFYRSLQEGEPSDTLFAILEGFILKLGMDENINMIPIEFILNLALYYGIYPDMESEGNILDLREGEFTSQRPMHNEVIDGAAASALRMYRGMGFVGGASPVTREIRRELLEGMLLYFKIHIPHFSELKSYSVFKEVFSV
jgi:DNA repair protein RecO (recombination protein O)